MPSNKPSTGTIDDWLRYARSDLRMARIATPDEVLVESLCFHAQQAAEKALKALLLYHSIPAPRTHNITTLLKLLPAEMKIPPEVLESAILTDYAIAGRYPGDQEPVEIDDYQYAVKLADSVVRWVESIIRQR